MTLFDICTGYSEKNKIKIFKGLIELEEKNSSITLLKETKLKHNIKIAPITQISQ